jgi:hypothetical protein
MTTEIKDRTGRCIGRTQEMSDGHLNYMDAGGRVVARVQNGNTYDAAGRLIGKGDMGMYALAQHNSSR